MSSSQRLNDLLQPLVEELGYEFVGLEYLNNPKQSVLRIYIDSDGDDGVGLEDCEKVSREVAALLDVEDPIKGHYNLEISSPGLDRPLFTLAQFERFAGEEAKVTAFAPVDGRRKFKGVIEGIEGSTIRMTVDGEAVELEHANIAKARLVPDWDALMAARKRG
ncbi:MAG: ribosome maturation factor RimP [Xanthomonadales bacterium]|jgi:ribosome maturation factor RimP|nr:ribosome maturation factor RimP [Xanthomonadales bacterium]